LLPATNGQFNLNVPTNGSANFTVRGLYNVTADKYVAIFSAQQTGRTIEEVNRLMDARIAKVQEGIAGISGVSMVIDMITFVPVYELEEEKKLFSKKHLMKYPQVLSWPKTCTLALPSPTI